MAIEIIMPRLTHDMTHGVIARWLKNDGDFVQKGEPLFEVETDKAISEVLSEGEGVLGGVIAHEGSKVPIGLTIAYMLSRGESPPKLVNTKEISPSSSGSDQPETSMISSKIENEFALENQIEIRSSKIIASPIAKRIAKDHGIDISLLTGSGPRGRIIERDILAFIDQQALTSEQTKVQESFDVVPLSQMRQTIAARMSESTRSAPHFILEVDVNMTESRRFRQYYNESQPIKISYTTILIKVVSKALRIHPQINVSYQGNCLHRYRDINLGIAVASPDGLRVPVLKSVEKRNLKEIQVEIEKIIENAKNGRIPLENLGGGTFTISNLGMYGIDRFQAIINPPEAAILAVGRIRDLPWVTPHGILQQPIINLQLSIDHRALDGAAAAPFLVDIQKLLENPYNLL
jgi:pyruvate dehydrogenase E2 component (dihydrolipoamide acetyltransferase)